MKPVNRYNHHPRVFGDEAAMAEEARWTADARESYQNSWQPAPRYRVDFQFPLTVKDVPWRVYHVRKYDPTSTLRDAGLPVALPPSGTLVVSDKEGGTDGGKFTYFMHEDLLTKEQIINLLERPCQMLESTHSPTDPYSAEDRKRFNEESWARSQKMVDESGVARFQGPFIGPWIEHSDHRYSRSWHPALCGGGPAAVVQGHGPRYQWFAWHNLLGNASGEVSIHYPDDLHRSAVKEAMAAADKFLDEEEDSRKKFGPFWTHYPLVVTLKIEASPWSLARSVDDDQWIRTWKDWPDEKALAARITRVKDDGHMYHLGEKVVSPHVGKFQWVCWGIYSEGDIGDGYAETFEEAKKLAEATLMEYCQASEARP